MSETAVRMDCGVVAWVKRNTLRWYGHATKMNEYDFTKRVYESTTEGRIVRGRPLVKCINSGRVFERERESGRERSGMRRERVPEQEDLWRQLCRGHPLGGGSREGTRRRRYR